MGRNNTGSRIMGEPLSDSEFAALAVSAGYKSCCELGHGVFVQRSPHKPKTVLNCFLKDVDPCEVWCRQPVDKLREYCNIIKIRIFWPLLFQSESNYLVADWGSIHILDWNWKKLCDLVLVEDLVDLTKKVVNVPHFIGGILRIGSRLENGFFDVRDALDWIRCTGNINILQKLEKLGDFGWLYLETFFGGCKYYITKVALEDCNLVEEFKAVTCENCRKKSESMKQKGNEEFSQGKIDHAIVSYTKAIEFCPANHLLYGNRALCLILTKQYKRALADGKRATILKPNWPKGHYHFCKALSLLGEHELALEANERAQELCKNILDGLKDLIQQNDKLKKTLEETKGTKEYKQKPKNLHLEKKGCGSSKSHLIISQEQKEIEKDRRQMQFDHKDDHYHQKHDTTVRYATDGIPRLPVTSMPRTENKVWSSDFPPSQSHQHKGRSKNKPGEPEKKQDHLDSKIESKTIQDKLVCTMHQVDSTMLLEVIKSLVHDGYTALMDQRCHSAEQMFSQLLNIVDPSELKQLNLRVINYVVFIYGHATSLLGIGQPEALAKAEDQFKRIIVQYQEERFDCLAYYGIGKVYLRQNRFSDALNQFMKSQTMINHKIVPGVLTWPTTSQVIEETRTENLQLFLKNCIEECRFPPEPDAVCRYQQCHGHSKIQIFFTDPDFKGFIRITCCQQCRVEFHTSCWKKLKTANYSDKNDKDFLQELCFTPDCKGLISKIVIFSSSGLVKCEFEQKITKPKEPPRAVIKQKCSSFRKLKRKEEKKLRRKRAREDALHSSKQKIEENQLQNEPCQYHNRSGYAGDQVLQRIIQNAEQIKTAVRDASKLLKELLSWSVISEEDYTSYCKTSSVSHAVVEQLISYLIREENRVKTRGFIRVLSELEEVDPKLQRWMKHLNDLGLTATVNFILQYGQSLTQLDFSILSSLWNEKYGSKFDYVSSSSEGREILDYFLKPPLEKVRCFIWLLEDNRENFPSLHQALDEFFDKTDNPTIILKKHGNEDIWTNGIKVKNKSRKKNYKDPRSVLVLSSGVSTAPQEENTFIEENTLDFTYYEPCIIPEYLRRQLEEFESAYGISNIDSYQRLDDNLNQTCESLYDYFSQILEEHGPMELNNELLVGEYEHFPEEAQKIVEDEGGLKSFLLKSHRFVMVDNFISLRHDVLTKESKNRDETENNEGGNYIVCDVRENSFQNKIQLNPAAKEFEPMSYPKQPHTSTSADISLGSCETPQYLTYSLPTPWQSVLSQDIDPVENMPYFSEVLLYQDFRDESRFLPQTPWDYQCERTSPVTSPLPLLSNGAKQPGYTYADHVTHQDNDELASSDRKYVSSNFIPADIETYRDPQCLVENSDNAFYEDSFSVPNGTDKADCDIQMIKKEKESRSIPVKKNNPHTRMVAVQVNNEVTDRETNTLPFHPFEKQQGDILRMEKEHQVLKEQLKEAQEKYEQLENRSSEEINVLEELIKKIVEERGIFKKEVEWLHQALEIKVKKWQQEKKENQENLKAMRNTAKKHMDTNDRYSKTIDEKEKEYNTCLNTYLETSNKFANEKVKLEELIKKSQDDFKEHEKRAVKAEISVLQNWKESELCKLNGVVAKAEANLKMLKSLNSSSASALPDLKSQINYWEVFISNIKKQMEKVKVGYEEKIEKVKNGARNCLTKIEAVDLSSLPSVLRKQSRPAVSDPALVLYSFASAQPNSLPAVSSSADQGPVTASFNTQAGVKPANANSKVCSASDGSVKTNSKARAGSYADKVLLTSMSKVSGSNTQNIRPNQTHQDNSDTQMKPSSNNTFENIIAHLQTIFPGYSSSEFTRFIKDVQRRSGNTLSLSSTEILSRVTDLILDQQNEASTSVGRPTKSASSASAGQTGTQSQEAAAEGNVSSAPKARPAHKSTSSKNTLPSQPNLQPWGNAGATPKSKWKKIDYIPSSDDPCIICHDELSRDSCELECGHHFHRECIRKWLKEHSSTCPICRIHVLLPEDFPELPARNKYA
ncbi:E3 ubiquitin-protein ligase TTC3 isoform X3 [Coturnix japonica]|uniref:E3 ubiquitin-protein ligase TTC3 isoform X3 n=1 Tax=Coturnix japonica TaxID=93934 RepID=UPI0013A5ED73|nr:E3 ubiquitin-protein ligase TTC3 isoform X3 [Coturnix japonica]